MRIVKDFLARYYQKRKKKIQKESHKNYQNLSKEQKKKKMQRYGRERYKNIFENEKKKRVEYRKRYYEKLKNKTLCLLYHQESTKIIFKVFKYLNI